MAAAPQRPGLQRGGGQPWGEAPGPSRAGVLHIPRTASHCWALQREQNPPVHMWPFFQLNVKSPPVGGLLIRPDTA